MSDVVAQEQTLVTFYRAIEQARLPIRADRSAIGTLPTRAFRYCDPVTTAASFGYYFFAPMDFSMLFDGNDVFWTFADAEEWLLLDSAAQFPGMSAYFDTVAPRAMQGCAPPMLTQQHEAGVVQIWSGMLARTALDWSLLIRSPANLPGGGGFNLYEGIVETDHWFGPLFINLQLTRTNMPIEFKRDWPLFQVQPLPRAVYEEHSLDRFATVTSLADFSSADWDAYYRTVVEPNNRSDRPLGEYAVAARKRRKSGICPLRGRFGISVER